MSVGRLADDVGFLLSKVSGQVVRATNSALADHGLRVRQYSVLALAAADPAGLSQRDLADQLGLDPSQVVVIVDDLVDAGLVERQPSPGDRRTKRVVATSAGRRRHEQAARRAAETLAGQLAALSETEQATLRHLLSRVVAGPERP